MSKGETNMPYFKPIYNYNAIAFDEKGKPHFFVFKKIMWWTKAVEIYE